MLLPIVPIAAALADENRARLILGLAILREKGIPELCVCQMTEFLALANSTVSKHLSILKNAGLVDSRKQGRWMYYHLASDNPTAEQAVAWLRTHALATPKLLADERKKWEAILNEDPEELCRRQACGIKGGGNSTCCSSAPVTPAAPRWRKASPRP